jgi:PAS domain S-box-containing protein
MPAAFFEAMFQASPLAIVALDREGRIIMWNRAAQRIFGWSESEVLGRRPPYVPDHKQSDFLALRERELTGEFLDGVELRRQRKDGTPVDVRLWTAPLRDADGRVTDVLGMLEDITAQRRAEAALREGEEQRGLVLQSAPVVLYRAQASGSFAGMWVSENVERLTGFPAARFAAEPSFWASRLHPEDRDDVFKPMQETREGALLTWQYRWQCADGTYRWFLDQACLRTGHGENPPEYVGTWLDITERKRAEAALALRTKQLEAIRAVAMELTQTLELAPLLQLILERATELLGVRSGVLYRWEETAQELVASVRYGPSDVNPPVRLRPGEGVAGAVAERRDGLLVNDFRTSPYATPWFLEHTTHTAVLAEPLLSQARLYGVIVLSNFQMPNWVFSDEAHGLLRLFAAEAAIAIQNAELFQEAKRERDALEVVASLAQGISASLDLDAILQKVAEGARELTGADLAYIALRDEATGALVFRHGAGLQYEVFKSLRIEPGKGVGGLVLATGEPFRTAHYVQDPRFTKDYLAATLSEGVVAELAVPISTKGRIEGLLFVSNRSARAFTGRDERTLRQMANHAAVAIRNAQLHEVAVRRARQFEALNTVTHAVLTELHPRSVAPRTQRVLEGVQILFPDAAGMLLEQPGDAGAFRVAASLGLRRSPSDESFRLRPGEGLAGIAMATRRPVVSDDLASDPRFVSRAWAASEGVVAGMVLPLVCGDRVTGVLGVFLRRPHTFTNDEVNLLQAFAAQCAVGLENARLFEQVYVGREQLLNLTQRVVAVQEEERSRLARELHDEAGQALTALRISLDLVHEDLPADAVALRRRMGDASRLTESIMEQVRRLAQALRPPTLKTLGLHAALEGYCRDYSRRTGVAVTYKGRDLPGLPDNMGIHLYRLVQEALTNVGKYAQVDRARVTLGVEDGAISLSVEDNGAGFDASAAQRAASPKHLGLIGMRERIDQLGGRLEITSQVGQGTRILARVPWKGAP